MCHRMRIRLGMIVNFDHFLPCSGRAWPFDDFSSTRRPIYSQLQLNQSHPSHIIVSQSRVSLPRETFARWHFRLCQEGLLMRR